MTQRWVWQNTSWPQFTYDAARLAELERQYLQNAHYLLGVYSHIAPEEQTQLKIDLVSEEAVESSAIEGEILDRSSVQASLRHNFGLTTEPKRVPARELGIALMMTDLYKNFADPLSHEVLYLWHLHLMNFRADLHSVGSYRQHNEPMQIVSGSGNKTRVHYEAPPSAVIPAAMKQYIYWFNHSQDLPIITRAGMAHVYFEMIHPFEDGNGRIGRALVEKAISQSLKHPLISAISRTIQKQRKKYYTALAECNTSLEITTWLEYFAHTMLEAQQYTRKYMEFVIAKSKFYEKIKGDLNERQSKVIARMFRPGVDGFEGGLSAENYISITQTSRATATRDLQDLVAKKILYSTGERKSTRYFLNLS